MEFNKLYLKACRDVEDGAPWVFSNLLFPRLSSSFTRYLKRDIIRIATKRAVSNYTYHSNAVKVFRFDIFSANEMKDIVNNYCRTLENPTIYKVDHNAASFSLVVYEKPQEV